MTPAAEPGGAYRLYELLELEGHTERDCCYPPKELSCEDELLLVLVLRKMPEEEPGC